MNDNPIFLMDVDGVLNAVPISARDRPEERPPAWSSWRSFRSGQFIITYSPELMDELRSLEDVVEFRWLTTWSDLAGPELSPHFGIGADWPVSGGPEPDDPADRAYRWWKFPVTKRTAKEGRPVIWADDDLDYAVRHNEDGIADWQFNPAIPRILMISPDPKLGLTPAHIQQVRDFLKEVG